MKKAAAVPKTSPAKAKKAVINAVIKAGKKVARKPKGARDTPSRQHFLDAAEFMFAEYGYDGAKIRAIAERSKVNLGALHHYWGSKEELFSDVCSRRLQDMNTERLQRFAALTETAEKQCTKIDIRDLFRASIEPTFFLNDMKQKEQAIFRKFYGRVMTEPSPVVGKVMRGIFSPVSKRFFVILRDLCPHLSTNEFYWRAMCIFGSFLYAPAYTERMAYYAEPGFDYKNVQVGIDQLVEFLVAGMLAPALPQKKPARKK